MKRSDGTRVKDVDAMYAIIPYIMVKRYDAMNMITLDVPVDSLNKYIKEKRAQNIRISHLSIVVAAYLRTTAWYPLLNRFIANKKIYQRNAFDLSMVVLKNGLGDMEGIMSKVRMDPNDTIENVQALMDEYVAKNREPVAENSTEKLIRKLLRVPGLVNIGVGLFKLLDKYGMLPKKIIDASPFHCSLVISNLASIRTNHIFHHLYEFGTTSVIITMGNLREVAFRDKDGVHFRTCLPLGVVMDERICSGHYFALVFQQMKKYFSDPSLLEMTFEEEKTAVSSRQVKPNVQSADS